MKPEQDWETGRETAGCWAGLPLEDFLSADGQRTPRREALYGEAQATSPEDVPSSTQTDVWRRNTRHVMRRRKWILTLSLNGWLSEALLLCPSPPALRLLLSSRCSDCFPAASVSSVTAASSDALSPSFSFSFLFFASINPFFFTVCLSVFLGSSSFTDKSYFNNWIFILFS